MPAEAVEGGVASEDIRAVQRSSQPHRGLAVRGDGEPSAIVAHPVSLNQHPRLLLVATTTKAQQQRHGVECDHVAGPRLPFHFCKKLRDGPNGAQLEEILEVAARIQAEPTRAKI